MDALTYIGERFDVTREIEAACAGEAKCPIEIRNTNRGTLARLFYLLEHQRGVEVGVERGMYSQVICEANPSVRLTCVDAWKAYRGYRDHVDQEKLDRFFAETQERLAPFKGVQLLRKFSVEAAKDFANGSLDFVYLDGNHNLQNVIADLAAWTPKVRPGGIVAGHDYIRYQRANQVHVIEAVHAWTSAYKIRPWFVLGSEAKREGELRDDARSWFWVHDPEHYIVHARRVKQ